MISRQNRPFSLIFRGILSRHANITSPKPQAPVPPRGTLAGDEKSITQKPSKALLRKAFLRVLGYTSPVQSPPKGGVVVPPPHRNGRKPLRRNGSRLQWGGHLPFVRARRRRAHPRGARAGMVYPPALRAGLTSHGPAGRDLVRQEGWPPSRQVVYRRPWPAHQRGPRGHAAGPRPAAGPAGG